MPYFKTDLKIDLQTDGGPLTPEEFAECVEDMKRPETQVQFKLRRMTEALMITMGIPGYEHLQAIWEKARLEILDDPEFKKGERTMPKTKKTDQKPLTKSQMISALAGRINATRKDTELVLGQLCALAYEQAPLGFTIPGLGKLELKQRKARMGRNPATGETIKIPAKKVLKFRIAKAAKDAVLG